MSALTRHERLDDLFPEMFRRFMQPMTTSGEPVRDIRIDVTENEKDYVVRAEMPGAKKDDVHVEVDGNRISISAEVHKESEEKSGQMLLRETFSGRAARSFTLGNDIDEAGATAKLEHGVLKLTLPKRADGHNRSITIQ